MNKNVLIVLVIILIPIVLLGFLAVTGAENFEKLKDASGEGSNNEGNATASMTKLVPMASVGHLPALTNDLAAYNELRVPA